MSEERSYRLRVAMGGPGAVDRVRQGLLALYDEDPRYGPVADERQAWIGLRLWEQGGEVRVVSTPVHPFEEASLPEDLADRLGAEVARDRSIDVPDGAQPMWIGYRVPGPGEALLVRTKVSRGEVLPVRGPHPLLVLTLGALGGRVDAIRGRFGGAAADLLEVARCGARFVPPRSVAGRVDDGGFDLEGLGIEAGRDCEVFLHTHAVRAGKGPGTLLLEAAGRSFVVRLDVRVAPT